MTGMRSEDVRVVLGRIGSLDRDEWGRSWAAMAQDWMSKGEELEGVDRAGAGEAYIMAWRYASFGGWPIAISPEKKKSYRLSLDAFRRFGRIQPQPIETVEIPVAGSSIVVNIQMPKASRPVPVMISIGGLDSYKEYVAERYGPVYLRHGVGYVAVDSPNTGEARVPADQRGERIYFAVIDYLVTRKDVNPTHAEVARLKLAVDWAGPLDLGWSTDVARRAIGSHEYLFDLPQAITTVFGYDSPEAYVAGQYRMSIVKQGLLGKPTPRMLVVNGLKDTLVQPLTPC